jgi:UDP-N-acetylmuramyl tripeptide synthase
MRRRGAALPGLVVEKLSPRFMVHFLDKLSEGVIIITGTNGKTTSTKMLTKVLGSEKNVLSNPTGSNFIRGIVSSIIQHADWLGRLPYDIAVFELDEAYAAKFVEVYKPKTTVVLNVMRDQMDRFGEIDHTAKLISKVVSKTTDFVILNRDDPRVYAMRNNTKKDIYYFGVSKDLRQLYKNDDELHLTEDDVIFNSQTEADIELLKIESSKFITYKYEGRNNSILLNAKGTYNAQNAIAVILTALKLNISVDNIATQISKVKPAFGRGEMIRVGKKNVVLQLVKNPGGFRHALLSGRDINQDLTMICINDDYADGRDVSWLWDVSFDNYRGVSKRIYTSGTRGADMALRLKYCDVNTTLIDEDLDKCLNRAISEINENQTLLVYTTYTAMLNLRNILTSITEVERV